MTREDIIRLAQQVGLVGINPHQNGIYVDVIEAYTKLVEEHERSECAKICDNELKEWGEFDSDVADVARAIRLRGEQE